MSVLELTKNAPKEMKRVRSVVVFSAVYFLEIAWQRQSAS